VSGGELARVIAAGGDPAKTVFSGVGKSAAEMEAALAAGIRCFNVESAAELEVLDAVAGHAGKRAPISIRVNPDVDPKTHPYIATGLKESKFGVAYSEAPALYKHAASLRHIDVQGIDCHIGSQITDLAVYVESRARCSRSSMRSRRQVSRCVTSTSAVASASVTATRRRSTPMRTRARCASCAASGATSSCSSPVAFSWARRVCC
jgi:diaminopimelate decarboxylase